MRRRQFIKIISGGAVVGVIGCAAEPPAAPAPDAGSAGDARPPTGPDAAVAASDAAPACDAGFVIMYDTHAQALYFDGTYGPLTGICKVEYVLAGVPVTLDFWHGHGGVQHRYTLLPEHFAALVAGMKVTLTTTVVEDHQHELFIDPTDPDYRVEGAEPVPVPRDGC
jgi:hypothetical protein